MNLLFSLENYVEVGTQPSTNTTPLWDYSVFKKLSKSKEILYHGSSKLITGELTTRSSSLMDGGKVVFATPYPSIAISFCSDWTDEDIEQGSLTTNGSGASSDSLYLKERKKNSFEKFFSGRSGYMYVVKSRGFTTAKNLTNYEFVNSNPVAIVQTYFIEDLYKALKDTGIKLIHYQER